jgi:general stress protein YciG
MEKQQRGFALMDPERRTQVARSGGRTAHQQGRAHKFTSAEAAAAGKLGGRRVSENRSHMSEIGRRGGRSPSILTQLGGPARELLHSLSAGLLLICQANSTFLFGPLTQGEPIVNAPQKPRRELADLYQLGLLTDREVNDGATPRGWLRVMLTARAKRMVAAKLRAR